MWVLFLDIYIYIDIVSSDVKNPYRLYVGKLVLPSGANGVQIGCWSSEMLQIAGESGSRGLVLGTHTIWGGVLWNREPGSYIA